MKHAFKARPLKLLSLEDARNKARHNSEMAEHCRYLETVAMQSVNALVIEIRVQLASVESYALDKLRLTERALAKIREGK